MPETGGRTEPPGRPRGAAPYPCLGVVVGSTVRPTSGAPGQWRRVSHRRSDEVVPSGSRLTPPNLGGGWVGWVGGEGVWGRGTGRAPVVGAGPLFAITPRPETDPITVAEPIQRILIMCASSQTRPPRHPPQPRPPSPLVPPTPSRPTTPPTPTPLPSLASLFPSSRHRPPPVGGGWGVAGGRGRGSAVLSGPFNTITPVCRECFPERTTRDKESLSKLFEA